MNNIHAAPHWVEEPFGHALVHHQSTRLLPGAPDGISKFTDAERDLLRNHGWTYDPKTTLWSPPVAK